MHKKLHSHLLALKNTDGTVRLDLATARLLHIQRPILLRSLMNYLITFPVTLKSLTFNDL